MRSSISIGAPPPRPRQITHGRAYAGRAARCGARPHAPLGGNTSQRTATTARCGDRFDSTRRKRTRILCPLPASTDSGSLLAGLRPGDIVTGVYGSTALIQEGRVNAAVVEARKRGVIIDVGHGLSRFDVHTARIALEQGLLPDVISSASQAVSPAGLPHPPLIDVMSTFLDLGLDVDQVQAMTTTHPARIIGRDAHLGTLALGAIANIAVVGIERRTGSAARIEVVATLRGGLWLHAGP